MSKIGIYAFRTAATALTATSMIAGVGCGSETGDSVFSGPNDASNQGDATFGDDANGMGGDGAGKDGGPNTNNCAAPSALAITPAASTANVTAGTSFTKAFTVTATYPGQAPADVTAGSFFTLSDPQIGTMNGATFTWGKVYGGTVTVSAKNCGVTSSTTLTLKLSAVLGSGGSGDGGVGLDAGGVAAQFDAAAPSSVAACNPTLVYPPDAVLLPPNTNTVEVHFLPGAPANNLFEVSFENAVTDVRIFTSCTGATAADGMPLNGGCVFELDQNEWNYIAQTNKNGDPLTVKVRGIGCDNGNVSSSNTRVMSFAKEDVVGTLYYWASMRAIVVAGQTVNSGGVFRYDFGVRGQSADPVLTPKSGANPTGLCIGCHDVSRDGRKMAFAFDDNDDDDEYGDVRTDIYDIASKTPAQPIVKNGANVFEPGYHTWNRSHSQLLLSDGQHKTSPPANAFTRVSDLGAILGYAQPGTLRGTTPDWAPDDSSVVFAAPPNVSANPPNAGFWQTGKDEWFAGASLYTSPWNATTNLLGAPTVLVAAAGTGNYYYPSYSPDGSLIMFNYAPSGPNFHNPLARVQIVAAGQVNPTPVDLAKLNDTGDLTNSWARWSPFVQNYKGGKIVWVTTSSTRSYGLRIVNDATKQNCYPTESPITPFFSNTPNCTRTQLWMAAVRLDAAGVMAGTDVSYPAFWLPFQDIGTNNHLGQWAQKSFTGTCTKPDAGADAGTCAPGFCCDNGGCTPCVTPPPPVANCTSNANCSNGSCCNGGVCGLCNGSGDGGPATPPASCSTCLDCSGQACVAGACGSCTNSSQCCAPLACQGGTCVVPLN